MDVMLFRLSRKQSDPTETFGHVEGGRMIVMLNRNDYWQCAYVIPKGTADTLNRAGLDKFRKTIGDLSPFTRDTLVTPKGLANGRFWRQPVLLQCLPFAPLS